MGKNINLRRFTAGKEKHLGPEFLEVEFEQIQESLLCDRCDYQLGGKIGSGLGVGIQPD